MPGLQSPIREQIKLDNQGQARPVDAASTSVYVPGPWKDRRVLLVPGVTETWSAARIDDTELPYDQEEQGWVATGRLDPREWNMVAAANGFVSGARLVASNQLHIASLEATPADRRLSVRVRLATSEPACTDAGGGESPCFLSAGLFTLFFTLTAADGRQVGGMEVTVGRRTRDLSVEVPLPAGLTGSHRLKAVLCADDAVLDNARTDLQL